MPTEFVEEPFTVAIKDGNAILSWPDGTKRSVPMRVFREEHRRAGEALAEYDHGNVVQFPKESKPRRSRRRDEADS